MVINPNHELVDHHSELLANGKAQTVALLEGQTLEKVREIHAGENLSEYAAHAKIFDADRSSSANLIDSLDP